MLVLATVAGLVGWHYGVGRYTATPGVINLSQAQAREKVQAAGLSFEVADRAYSETVTAGSVISTDPGAGEDILEDGTVSAVVSLGPERYAVPTLRGMRVDEAQEAVEEANLAFGDVTQKFNEKVAEGVVLSSDPATGTELKRDAVVDVLVSRGRSRSRSPTSPASPPARPRRRWSTSASRWRSPGERRHRPRGRRDRAVPRPRHPSAARPSSSPPPRAR